MDDVIDLFEIPEFLQRNKGEVRPAAPAVVVAVPVSEENWRRLEEVRREQKLVKARGRVAKMLARKADQQAAREGKTWDVVHGGWK